MTDDETQGMTRRGLLALGGAAAGGTALTGLTLATQEGGPAGGNLPTGNQPTDDPGDDGRGDGDGQEGNRHYRVTITNLTPGQPFTPPAVAAHRPSVEVFSVGDPANEPTQALAENGDTGPLLDFIADTNAIRDAAVGQTPLVPEEDPANTGNPYYTTVHLSADASATHLTFVSMLIATNDGIVGLDTVPLPQRVNGSRTYHANGYDVGTERNTERFEDLVPPAQELILGGEPEGTDESDEAIAENRVIRPHPGIEGRGNLPPEVYDWEEPAAVVQVERIDQPRTEFSARLSGENEVPPVETEASGEATFEFDDAADELSYQVAVSDIENVVAAHIHCGPTGTNGPVGVTLYDGEPVSEDGVLADGTVTEPDEDNGCGWESLDDVVAAMRGDHTYVNVHTEANPGGEIRGQIN